MLFYPLKTLLIKGIKIFYPCRGKRFRTHKAYIFLIILLYD